MKNEEIERHIEFILQQQANFADNLERQAAAHAEANARHDRVDRQIQELIQSMSIFRDPLISLTHHAERHEREMADLIERGKQTDARLNALILVVERHISGHQ
jgi:phage shock protein A